MEMLKTSAKRCENEQKTLSQEYDMHTYIDQRNQDRRCTSPERVCSVGEMSSGASTVCCVLQGEAVVHTHACPSLIATRIRDRLAEINTDADRITVCPACSSLSMDAGSAYPNSLSAWLLQLWKESVARLWR